MTGHAELFPYDKVRELLRNLEFAKQRDDHLLVLKVQKKLV